MVTQPGYGAAGIGTQGPALGQVTPLPLSPRGPGRSLNVRVLHPHLVQGTEADTEMQEAPERRGVKGRKGQRHSTREKQRQRPTRALGGGKGE